MSSQKLIEIRGNKFILDDDYLEWHSQQSYHYSQNSNEFCFRWVNNPGQFEIEEHTLFNKYANENSNVLDLGGFIGTLSCSINKTLKNPKNHIVTEIHPFYRKYLKKNRDINNCKFKVLEKINKIEEVDVDYCFDTIVSDIEGDEFKFILDNFDYISEHVSLLIVEFHDRYYALPNQPEKNRQLVPQDLKHNCLEILKTKYNLVDSMGSTSVYKRKIK
jgi:hypothetical protein